MTVEEQNIFEGRTVIHQGLKAIVTDVDWPARKIDLSYFRAGESQPPPKYRVLISSVEIVPEKKVPVGPGALLQNW